MKELSAHGAKQIIKRTKKEVPQKGYVVNEVTYSFSELFVLVKACNPKVTESTLRSRLKAGRRKWETLIGEKK